jgi:hypothetical protein
MISGEMFGRFDVMVHHAALMSIAHRVTDVRCARGATEHKALVNFGCHY